MAGFQQVRVFRDLEFVGAASHQPNVKGLMMTEYKIFDETFFADPSEHDWLSTTGANGLTMAHAQLDGGAVTLTCGATAEDCGEFYHLAQWSPASKCGMEAKLKIDEITNVCVVAGFVDEYENTNDHVAGEIVSAAARACANTNDFALMTFDTAQTTDVWYTGVSEGGTEATPVAAVGSLTPVAGIYFKIRIQTDSDGNVTFYYNGVAVGYSSGGIAPASTDLLTPYVGIISHSTGAVVSTVSRITIWQEN